MAYTYDKQLWKDYPDTSTPITADRLNHMEDGISEAAKSGGGDTIPVGSEFDYDGTTVPEGFEQVSDPTSYSSDEIVIGTWFGKKLYRKSFRFNELATGTNNVVHGIDNLNEIINAYGSCKRNDDKIQPIPRVDASELGWQIGITDISTQNFQVYVGTRYNGTSKIKSGNATLEYTKTTDTATQSSN